MGGSGNFLIEFLLLTLLLSLTFLADARPGGPSHPIAAGVTLRILSVGDSLTYGWGSADQTGYRSSLYRSLAKGNEVEFIGSVAHGDMASNSCECYPGSAIHHLAEKVPPTLVQRPNIVLLMAGTNDIVFMRHVDGMGKGMGKLLDLLLALCPDAVVLVMSIPPLLDKGMEERVSEFNRKDLPALVNQRREGGKKIKLLELDLREENINKSDNVHPTDEGYMIIAETWYQGILEADIKGWIQAPAVAMTVGLFGNTKQMGSLLSPSSKTHFAIGLLVVSAISCAVWRAAKITGILFRN